ncbi:MAG: glycosyltransferase family protein [Myxococcota bacterium]
MRIVYGVVGEGMGHATRSRVVIEHLLSRGHEVRVVVSGRAFRFLTERFKDRPNIEIHEIRGFHLRYEGNTMDVGRSVLSNLGDAPKNLVKNIKVWRELVADDFDAQVVISDFESWAFFYGLNHFVPVISIDNMQIINRCEHPDAVTRDPEFQLAKAAVKAKLPGAYHYLITTFFYPPVRKDRTTLLPPILRPEIRNAVREPGKHVLVYQTASANTDLVPMLKTLPYEFRVYGMGKEGTEGNVTLRAFSETGFVDDLRTAKAVVAGGGFSLMGEAVHLRVPMFSVPIAGQYEQELNARWLAELGYGAWAKSFDPDELAAFLADVPALTTYTPRDDSLLHATLDKLLSEIV